LFVSCHPQEHRDQFWLLSALPGARWLESNVERTVVVLRTNEMVTMLEAAASGADLALLPCMLADADPRLVRLTPQVLVRCGLLLVYRREQRGTRSVRIVAGLLIKVLRAQAARITG
jgi:DNA-binding transcriptional LysR family regulator